MAIKSYYDFIWNSTNTGSLGIDNWVGTSIADTYFGEAGADTLNGGLGDDYLFGGLGADTLLGGEGLDVLYGGIDNDILNGGAGVDYLYGEAGNDVFSAWLDAGNDFYDGGAGVDTLDFAGASFGVNVTLGDALSGTSGTASTTQNYTVSTKTIKDIENVITGSAIDNVKGNAAANTIHLGDGADYAAGFAGNDILYGQGGADTLEGGDGNDVLNGGTGNDVLTGGLGMDKADYSDAKQGVLVNLVKGTAQDAPSTTLISSANSIGYDKLSGIEEVKGSAFGDNIYTEDDASTLAGYVGINNLVESGSGNDVVFTGMGNDVVYGGAGNDQINTGSGNDTVHDGFGSDIINLGSGNDTIFHSMGTSAVVGSSMDGGEGVDVFNASKYTGGLVMESSGAGQASISTGGLVSANLKGFETIYGTAFNDTVAGSVDALFIDGGAGNDTIDGGAGNDKLYGGAGEDTLYGGTGNDILFGGAGNDYMSGGDGTNTYLMSSDYGSNVVEGAQQGVQYDKLDFSAATGKLDLNIVDSSLGFAQLSAVSTTVGFDVTQMMASTQISGIDEVVGTKLDDVMLGSSLSAIKLVGGDGNDLLGINSIGQEVTSSAAVPFTLDGGNGDDEILGSLGADNIIGGAGNDWIESDVNFANDAFAPGALQEGGVDSINAGSGNDMVYAGAGNDKISSSDKDGNDLYDAGAGTLDLVSYSSSTVSVILNANGQGALDVSRTYVGMAEPEKDTLLGVEYIATGSQSDVINFKNHTYEGALTVSTGEGNDIIQMGNIATADKIYAGAGNDLVIAGAGADYISTDIGNDVIVAGDGNDTVSAGAGDDFIQAAGNTFMDPIAKEALAIAQGAPVNVDELMYTNGAGAGNDTYDGGDGIDTISFANAVSYASGAAQGINVNLIGGNATGLDTVTVDSLLTGTDVIKNIENVIGTAFGDKIVGSVLNNHLQGLTGNDIIDGFDGDDLIDGGDGNDNLLGGLGADTIYGGLGIDTINAQGGSNKVYAGDGNDVIYAHQSEGSDYISGDAGVDVVNYASALAGVNINLTTGIGVSMGSSATDAAKIGTDTLVQLENVVGSAFSDNLKGNTSANRLDGGNGNDTLSGEAGNDALYGGVGDDMLYGGDGVDLLNGSDGNDYFVGGAGNDNMSGGNGLDSFSAGTDAGSDIFDGGADTDLISYEGALAGVSINLTLGTGVSVASGTLTDAAGIGSDTIKNIENVVGGSYSDTLMGSAVANRLEGAAGSDVLVGSGGADTLVGGAGADFFKYVNVTDSSALAKDHILDMDSTDKIDLSALDAVSGNTTNDAFNFIGDGSTLSAANANGALWFKDGTVYASLDGDIDAEIVIQVSSSSLTGLDASHFLL